MDTIKLSRKRIDPHIYTTFLWGSFILFLSILLYPNSSRESIFGMGLPELTILSLLAMYFGAEIYFLISLYRCWSILQGSNARTTPGKAVGFIFIPFFDLYWIFVAIRGLSIDANKFLDSKNINENKISVALSLAACIAGLIPFINYFLNPILQNILIYQYAKFFNYSVKS